MNNWFLEAIPLPPGRGSEKIVWFRPLCNFPLICVFSGVLFQVFCTARSHAGPPHGFVGTPLCQSHILQQLLDKGWRCLCQAGAKFHFSGSRGGGGTPQPTGSCWLTKGAGWVDPPRGNGPLQREETRDHAPKNRK